MRQSVGPGITIKTNFPESGLAAHLDTERVALAMINLALNARDLIPKGGCAGRGERSRSSPAVLPVSDGWRRGHGREIIMRR